MTRTEDDLRTLLQLPIEPVASTRVLQRVVGVGSARPSTARRWRIGLVTAVALIVVVGAVSVVLALHPGPRTAQPAVPTLSSSPRPSPTMSDDRPVTLRADSTVISFPAGSGYHVGLTTVSADGQSVEVEPDVGAVVGTVVVGRGAVPASVGSKPAVDLGGGVSAVWVTAPGGEGKAPVGDALAWSVGGLSVVVSPSFDGATDADVEAVARAVVIGDPVAVRVPVSVSSWPPGWSLGGVIGTHPHRDGAPATTDKDVRIDVALAGTAGAAVSIDSAGLGSYGGDTGTPVEIAGRTWLWDASANSFTWHGPDRFVSVTSFNAGIGRADLQAMVAATTLAPSFADESTWFDATTAFPR